MFNSIGTTEWLVIGLVGVFLIGGKRLPDVFKSLGKAVKEFKDATKDTD